MDTKKLKEKLADVISAKLDTALTGKDILDLTMAVSELERNEVLRETFGQGFSPAFPASVEEKE